MSNGAVVPMNEGMGRKVCFFGVDALIVLALRVSAYRLLSTATLATPCSFVAHRKPH